MNCRRCSTEKSMLTRAEDEVRRIARQMSRPNVTERRMSALKEDLATAKINVTGAKEHLERGHDCDNKLSDEHWTRSRA